MSAPPTAVQAALSRMRRRPDLPGSSFSGKVAKAMTLLLLEALGALLILVGIVWWTMFSGRDKGELPPHERPDAHPKEKNE
jgi:enterochelin esterase-like enzyme